jgi:integrase
MPLKKCPQMLSDIAIKKSKATDKAYRLYDRDGLYIEIAPSGGKYWRLKYRFDGKEKRLALGVYPAVKLGQAREQTIKARELLATDIDPGQHRKAEKHTEAYGGINSFEAVAREWHAKFSPDWSSTHANKLIRRLEMHAFPFIGSKALRDISAMDVLALLQKPEASGQLETAHGIRVVVGQVCRYAVATGRATADPTPMLRGAIKAHRNKHMASVTTEAGVAKMMRAIDQYNGGPIVRTALLVSALTFQRPGNIRMMEWAELDLSAGIWTIPSEKMKRVKADKLNGSPHLVPLASQCVIALRNLHPITGHTRLVFPGERSHDRPISENTINVALRTMGYSKDEATAHGFRAMARTLLDEILEEPIHVIEAQLAHKVRDALGNAYNRTSHIEQRKKMMQRWADYLDKIAVDRVVTLSSRKKQA